MKKLTNEQIETIKANPILKDVFPELFKKELPKTGFLKSESGVIVYRTGENSGYGIYSYRLYEKTNDWSFMSNPDVWQEATKEEFLEAMKPELKRRGFVDGARVKSAYSDSDFIFKSDSLKVYLAGNIESDGFSVFFKGKFAEILPQFEVDQIGYAWDDEDEYPVLTFYIGKDQNNSNIVSLTHSKYGNGNRHLYENFSIEDPEL
tara:strand:- start:7036 stop:7650 length:615 start_codon:yes stop_codon:yes gene_type:complete